jgi:hypothetical protein
MITVDVDQEGGVQITVEGVAGKSCKDLTADIEKALGKVTNDVKTPEYNKAATKTVENRR